MQYTFKIAYRILIVIVLSCFWIPGWDLNAQGTSQEQVISGLSAHFVKPEILQKTGQISFNVIRIINNSDTAIRFKPILVMPDGWLTFSNPFNDTIVAPHDSISLSFRFQLPNKLSADEDHQIGFKAYSMRNKLLSDISCDIHPEIFHDWDVVMPPNRIFFYPRNKTAEFSIHIENNGNSDEIIHLNTEIDKKIELTPLGQFAIGQDFQIKPYTDTTLKFLAKYISEEDRVFDVSKLLISATAQDKNVRRPLMIEKYNDTYAPVVVDRALPHQFELGFRTFTGNDRFLPFVKARGLAIFKNSSSLLYNFNYYSLTGNESLISNSYYNFQYRWKNYIFGLGAFSSHLGRNLYTRNGASISSVYKLSPTLNMEVFASQSFFSPKTSLATGFRFGKKELELHGSMAYDVDHGKHVNTGSVMLQSNLIKLYRKHNVSFNIYGYHEYHDLRYDYTLAGFAWDINYVGKFGDIIAVQVVNNYGSPNMPGPQMGLLNFSANVNVMVGEGSNYFSVRYINSSRKYHTYTFEGVKQPNSSLYDQYASLKFHSNTHPNHLWEAGPSIESYNSYRPVYTVEGQVNEYHAQKVRFEYKSVLFSRLALNIKTGLSRINIIETSETTSDKYDFHLIGGYNFKGGYSITLNYDNGPMVNNGLYQYSGDVKNHSLAIGPGMRSSYFKDRLILNVFANLIYRFDLNYAALNVNPKIEAYLFRDWYAIASGTYHYTKQQYPGQQTRNSYVYFEFSIMKRWGKSEHNKWQRDTRRLKVVLFQDDNGNGIKDDNEKGVPFVKTRLKLTNTDSPNISTQFPVDIILLSNKAGTVNYNHLPRGFYEMTITPLTDMKEYFYVNRSAEKLELTKNATYYIPFQKASKISGHIEVKRQKYIKSGEELLDLKNIKITAYNNEGNSYSSFTLEDGSFTIYVPDKKTYYVRMGNVFGSNYRITNNDSRITVGDTAAANKEVVLNVMESSRQIKFKTAKPAVADTTKPQPLKIKILHGKFYENSSEAAVDKNAMPHFDMPEAPVPEEPIIPGNYYVVVGTDTTRTEAVKLIRIIDENGIDTKLGYNEADKTYYIFTKYFKNKGDAKAELDHLKKASLKDARIVEFKP